MPFFGDTESRDERRGPIWAPFAIIRDNVERLVLVNLGWSIQLLPGVLALAFPELPPWLRIGMGLYSATVMIPGTGTLYALSLSAARGEHLSIELARDHLRELALPSFRALAPLYGVFGVLIWVGVLSRSVLPGLTTMATLAALLLSLCAIYWGPLLVTDPTLSALSLAARSTRLAWRYPAETFATSLVCAGAIVIGMVSIAGLFLIIPVVITLLHTERYLDLAWREAAIAVRE